MSKTYTHSNASGRTRLAAVMAATIVLSVVSVAVRSEAAPPAFLPNGAVAIDNGDGTFSYYYPERMNLLANIPVPGSKMVTPSGVIWKGLDGKIHGNVVDPSTGDMHVYAPNPSATGTAKKYTVTTPSQPRPIYVQPRMVTNPKSTGPTNIRPYVPYNNSNVQRMPVSGPTYRSR